MSEASALLGDVVTRLLTERVTRELLETSEKGEWPAALWQAVEENGLTLPLVPEAQGGAGIAWSDAYLIVSAAGRHAAPIPLPETVVASWLLAGAGLEVPSGPLTLAPSQREERLALARRDGGWRVTGTATRVPWGRAAKHVVVVDEVDGRATVALVATRGARVTPDTNIAREPRDTLDFDASPVLAAGAAHPAVPREALRLYGAMVRAAQMAGGLEATLAMATRYATERRQFGKAIGQFQAIQQNLAVLAGHAAAAGMAAANAFRAADRGDLEFEVAVAKTRVGEAAGVAAGIAHQTHGAIGFTYEHHLQFVTRRLWSWRAEFGGESEWAAALGRSVAERGADALWPFLTAR
jgi:acyl-CoA dehydrogenase